jgi:tetratricopeptide (TPR) repeat protein
MTTTPASQNGLDRALEGLEELGLARPANVLLAEYLAAWTAAELLDAELAAKVSHAYNRLRYSFVPEDDAELREAVVALDAVAERLRGMNPEERARVCQNVLSSLPQSGVLFVRPSAEAPPATTNPVGSSAAQVARETPHEPSLDSLFEPSGARTQLVTAVPRNAPPRKRPGVPLEVCAVVALAVFFGGWFGRDAAEAVAKTLAWDEPESRRGVWIRPEVWVETIRQRGDAEMKNQHWRTARLALELALACSDGDKKPQHELLNSLAWSYLFPDEDGVTNPQRSLELANRAIELDRSPAYLDTAALAHFQLGQLSEALRLQREALVRANAFTGNALWRELAGRLKMFEEAARRQDTTTATKSAS